MNLNNVDNELNLKTIEVFKIILKKENVNILFEQNNLSYYNELIYVSDNMHNFSLYSYDEEIIMDELNHKYYNLLPKSIRKKYTNLTDNDLINLVSSMRIYKILTPIIGRVVNKIPVLIKHYKINYNNILIELDKLSYEKLVFYTKNVYKLQQLQNLNRELNIDQKYNIIFEDEKIKNDLYSTFYSIFKDIIKPPNSN